MRRTIWVAAVLCACSAMHENGEGPDEPLECSEGECSGAYLARFSQISGDCGPLADAVTMLHGLDDFEGCAVIDATWSGDGCQVDAEIECPRTDGRSVTIVGAIEQTDDACDHLIATATYRLYETTGMLLCSGTYRIAYERL